MTTSPEEANKSYQDFKALQQEWKEIKNIPADKANEVWKNYQLYVEQFYDMLKLNSEAREYDFKKNLEAKTQLCEAAEKLNEEEQMLFLPSTSFRTSTSNIAKSVLLPRSCESRSGNVSRLLVPLSTRSTSSTSKTCVPRKRKTSPRKLPSAKR